MYAEVSIGQQDTVRLQRIKQHAASILLGLSSLFNEHETGYIMGDRCLTMQQLRNRRVNSHWYDQGDGSMHIAKRQNFHQYRMAYKYANKSVLISIHPIPFYKGCYFTK